MPVIATSGARMPSADIFEEPAAGDNVAEFTVGELSDALKRTIEEAYGFVRVRGEISGFSAPRRAISISR